MNLPTTVGSALAMSRSALCDRSESPNLDGQLLLSQVLARPRAWLLAHPECEIKEQHGLQFLDLLFRCQKGEALPHLLGWWEFYGQRFYVNRSVLIPRPETELLVDAAVEYLERYSRSITAVDVGTGSGCVAITLAKQYPDLHVYATDVSLDALRVAQTNIAAHAVGQAVNLVCADLVSPISLRFDLVCANLPYIPEDEIDKLRVSESEPRIALDGGVGGLRVVQRLLETLPTILSRQGRAVLEIGLKQAESILEYVSHILPDSSSEIRLDYSGHPRLVVVDR